LGKSNTKPYQEVLAFLKKINNIKTLPKGLASFHFLIDIIYKTRGFAILFV
jgi:hypothetical protein